MSSVKFDYYKGFVSFMLILIVYIVSNLYFKTVPWTESYRHVSDLIYATSQLSLFALVIIPPLFLIQPNKDDKEFEEKQVFKIIFITIIIFILVYSVLFRMDLRLW